MNVAIERSARRFLRIWARWVSTASRRDHGTKASARPAHPLPFDPSLRLSTRPELDRASALAGSCGGTQTARVKIHTDGRLLDHGHAFAVCPDGHPGFALDLHVCSAPNCPCTDVELALFPRELLGRSSEEADEDVEPVAVQFDVRTREVRRVSDPAGWLAAPADETWLRGQLAGAIGDRIVARVDRLRASHDRRTWQNFAWSDRRPSEMVAHFELFPHDWDLLVQPGEHAAWIVDSYCVEPSCSCQDLAIQIQSIDGAALGEATLRLGGRGGVRVVRCAPGAVPYVDQLVEQESRTLHERFAEMRAVARRLKTWPQDLADPTAAVETLLGRSKSLEAGDFDRVHALGARVVAQLAAVVVDPAVSDLRRRRAARLLAATREPTAVDALAAAVRWADPEVDPDVFDDAVSALNALRGPSLAALLAVLPTVANDDERARVAFALADLRIVDPSVLAVIVEYVQRDPNQWIHHLRWQGDAAIAAAREALRTALDAVPERLDDALEAIGVLEHLGATVGDDVRGRVEHAEQHARHVAAGKREQAIAEAEAARAELAAFDRRARPGRNQPCWCGRGEKYKKCHLAADEITRGELVRRTLG
jgi:hypothetical protein